MKETSGVSTVEHGVGKDIPETSLIIPPEAAVDQVWSQIYIWSARPATFRNITERKTRPL